MTHALPLGASDLLEARKVLVACICELHGFDFNPASKFVSFDDGEMGSFRVLPETDVGLPERIVDEFEYSDRDEMGILITVYTRDGRSVSGLDFWRYDFQAAGSFPEPADLRKPDIMHLPPVSTRANK